MALSSSMAPPSPPPTWPSNRTASSPRGNLILPALTDVDTPADPQKSSGRAKVVYVVLLSSASKACEVATTHTRARARTQKSPPPPPELFESADGRKPNVLTCACTRASIVCHATTAAAAACGVTKGCERQRLRFRVRAPSASAYQLGQAHTRRQMWGRRRTIIIN